MQVVGDYLRAKANQDHEANNRWHLNCFRCNTCQTLLDSDANLLLLGDGSLICNNCTYSCSACNNKIEDLAILTGDQAFCASCFRCRNCKRKIENLRYARTSQGIFCMSCHESVMARRRKKAKAASAAKSRENDPSRIHVDKSLPALPPNIMPTSAFSPASETAPSINTDTPTELSPRPSAVNNRAESSSRSSSHRAPSTDRHADPGLTLPSTAYSRNKRISAVAPVDADANGDGDFFIPLALDPSPAISTTPRSGQNKENRGERDYFGDTGHLTRARPDDKREKSGLRDHDGNASTPHIAFQEKGRQPSTESNDRLVGKGMSMRDSPEPTANGKAQQSAENFRLQEVPKTKRSTSRSDSQSEATLNGRDERGSRSAVASPPALPPRKDVPTPRKASSHLATDTNSTPPRSSVESRPSLDSSVSSQPHHSQQNASSAPARTDSGKNNSIARKEIPNGAVKNSLNANSGYELSPSSDYSSTDGPESIPTVNGKPISGPVMKSNTNDIVPPNGSQSRSQPQEKGSESYMTPREPPAPPSASNGKAPSSPKLPRWSSGGDFTMEEDMARILGADEPSTSLFRRVSNAVRHGRAGSETSVRQGHGRSYSETTRTTTSPRWPKTPIAEDANGSRPHISSPIFISSPDQLEEKVQLRKELKKLQDKVADLEKRESAASSLSDLNKKLIDRRRTMNVLDGQSEIMIREMESYAAYIEKMKTNNQSTNSPAEQKEAIHDFVQRIEKLKQQSAQSIEDLLATADKLREANSQLRAEKAQLDEEMQEARSQLELARMEFGQLTNKNAQLADMNNDLTHSIQERFRNQGGATSESPKPPVNGLGIYHHKEKSNASIHLEAGGNRSGANSTLAPSGAPSQSGSVDADSHVDTATVMSAEPQVVNLRKGQVVKKFNWKKSGNAVAKGMKGFKGAFASTQQAPGDSEERLLQIGVPYNATRETPTSAQMPPPGSLSKDQQEAQRQGFGIFKKSNTMGQPPRSNGHGTIEVVAKPPNVLFGSDLLERTDFEHRHIPSIVTRCIEEVELRGMDVEGIYRKAGGHAQQESIKVGFQNTDDYDISDPDLDIHAVSSVLKQYLRVMANPLLTYEIYDRIVDSTRKSFHRPLSPENRFFVGTQCTDSR